MFLSIIKKIWTAVAHVQVLFVFIAFALMVSLSTGFMSDVFRKQLKYTAKTVLDFLETQINADPQFDKIREYIIKANLGKTGYGLLLDNNFEILIHSDPDLYGTKFDDVNLSTAKLVAKLNIENDVYESKMINYKGVSSITFIRKLNNGWYVGLVTPENEYYGELKTIRLILIILGIALATLLSAVLLRIVSAKKKAEELIQIMFDAMPLSANVHNGNFEHFECNKSVLKMFEMSSKQEYIENFDRLSPKFQPDGRLSSEKMEQLVENAFTFGYANFEWLHQKLNGEPIPCEVTLVRLKHDNEFVLAAYLRDLRDLQYAITQKNESEQSRRLLNNIINSIDAQVYVTVPHSGEILFVNDCMKKDFKVGDECIGEFCYKIFLNDKNKICDFCPCYKLDKDPKSTVVWELHNPVTNRIYRNTTRYIEWFDGRTVQIQHSVDMTELIAAKEQAEQSSHFKSQFLSRMSHEVRTPMNAILGITEIQLQDKSIPPGRREALEKIFNSGYLLLGIINDILDLSKIEAGKLELTPAKYDVPNLINDTVPLIIMQYEHKPIEFILHVDEYIPLTLLGDELRIKQILNNLLSNAFKYTDKGEVSLSVKAEYSRQWEEPQVTLVFRVSDTGHGMTSGQVEKLFDEYTRFNMEANRKTEGAGLGMSITQHLVRMMNGSISVESEPGKGSVFTVNLPQEVIGSGVLGAQLAENVKKFNAGRSGKTNNTPQFTREYMPYGKVLVVDDVETNLYVARGLMAPYGLSIETAASGFEAIDKIKNGAVYDIIFMDHFMPKMDGMETVKKLRALGYTLPIIALTANALTGQAEIFLENGFDGFISKPIDIRQLNASLNKYIRDKYPSETVNTARKQAGKVNKPLSYDMRPPSGPELAAIFTRDAEKALNTLKTMLSPDAFRGKDDFLQYVISVHSLKSALLNIFGETELSETALKLELAGRSENIPVITEETPAFLEKLEEVIKRIKPKEDGGAANEAPDKAYLAEKIHLIKTACRNHDEKAANRELSELEQRHWPQKTIDLLETIADDLSHNDLDEAANLIEDYEAIKNFRK